MNNTLLWSHQSHFYIQLFLYMQLIFTWYTLKSGFFICILVAGSPRFCAKCVFFLLFMFVSLCKSVFHNSSLPFGCVDSLLYFSIWLLFLFLLFSVSLLLCHSLSLLLFQCLSLSPCLFVTSLYYLTIIRSWRNEKWSQFEFLHGGGYCHAWISHWTLWTIFLCWGDSSFCSAEYSKNNIFLGSAIALYSIIWERSLS